VNTRLGHGVLTAVAIAVALSVEPLGAQSWTNATGNLAYKVSECGNLTLVAAVPNSDAVIAGVAARGLWVNTEGTTWSRLSDDESERVTNRPSSIAFDPTNPEIFWESGAYGPGLYKTTDGGKHFARLGDVNHSDWVSVDFSDPERKTLLAGGHEQGQNIYASTDGGATWKNIGRGLPANSNYSTHPFIIDGMTYLIGLGVPNGSAPTNGIYRSNDGGYSWRRVALYGASGPPLRTAKNLLFWTAPGRLLRSADLGMTWSSMPIEGLRSTRLAEMSNGRVALVGPSHLLISSDDGSTWTPTGGPLPYQPDGIAYSEKRKAFFIWKGDCREHVPANAVMMLQLDAAPATR
jgi:photosystem II stability/assembly factor-like uncharacterized protein